MSRAASIYRAPAPVTLKKLTFSAMPWETHPIDLVSQPQGWGPFRGPWQGEESSFINPAAYIDIGYGQSDNTWRFGPGYGKGTLFMDRSGQLVNNASPLAVLQAAFAGAASSTATIGNGVIPGQGATQTAPGALARLRKALGV
jgi:hypothetical protein